MTKVSSTKKVADKLPLIRSTGIILLPGMVCSLDIKDEESIEALKYYLLNQNNQAIVVFNKAGNKKNEAEKLVAEDINHIAIQVSIIQCLEENNVYKVILKAEKRVQLSDITFFSAEKYFVAKVEDFKLGKEYDPFSLEELRVNLISKITDYSNVSKKFNKLILAQLEKAISVEHLMSVCVSNLLVSDNQKLEFLEISDLVEQIAYLNSMIEVDLDLIDIEAKLRDRVKSQMEKNQKDYYLNEQMKAIQKELNNGEEGQDEISELKEKIESIKMSSEAKEKALSEVKKLSMMNPISAEASVVRNYIDWLLTVPWNTQKNANIDLKKAEEFLEQEHYALTVVKERVIEYLAALKKSKNLKAPIICLVGPPGVGKTSLAKSLAQAANREFTRISLGGVKDEAEIRGHRRTYIGAMPGKIIQSMKKAKVSNPLFLLDEIDKMSADFKGDPSSALLEVLDPEQNSTFIDHYLEVEYDLSKVMFVATANSLDIQEALLDRMEIIYLSGYSEEEKLEIVKRHILPKTMKESCVGISEFSITDDAILALIRGYTKESGVRELTRVIYTVLRKSVKHMFLTKEKSVSITLDNYVDFCGNIKFKDSVHEQEDLVGITNGLAWTRFGGDTLYIETLKYKGKGNIKITGKLGDVMQESVQAAYSYLKNHSEEFGLKESDFTDYDIHVHVPEGATPKDGPSAGVTMVTSIYSCLSDKKVRKDIAMTGEITLRGRVLPIGGVREKLLAALRVGITNVIIPKDNENDLVDIPEKSLRQLNVITVSHIREVINQAII